MTKNKKTAVFGLYPSVDAGGARGGRARRRGVLERRRLRSDGRQPGHRRTSRTRSRPRRRKARRPASPPAERSAARWACSRASARWRFPASARSSRPARSWARSRASASAERSAGWSARWSAWAFPSTKRSATRAALKEGGVLLSVHCDTSEEITRAKDLLKRTGAERYRIGRRGSRRRRGQ